MATKLEVYNAVLVQLGARTIATLSDNRAERRTLDAVYSPALAYALEAAFWNFATRTEELSPSETIESNFGWKYVFEKPDDYVRIIKISDNETLLPTLDRFSEEADYILADCDPLYLQYVSDDVAYGGDPGKWPASFTTALQDEISYRAASQIAGVAPTVKDWLAKQRRKSMYAAKSKDGANQAPSVLPAGRLVRSRIGGAYNRMRRSPFE